MAGQPLTVHPYSLMSYIYSANKKRRGSCHWLRLAGLLASSVAMEGVWADSFGESKQTTAAQPSADAPDAYTQLGDISKYPSMRQRWSETATLYELSDLEKEEIAQAAATEEKKKLAIKFFLENKWADFFKEIREKLKAARRVFWLYPFVYISAHAFLYFYGFSWCYKLWKKEWYIFGFSGSIQSIVGICAQWVFDKATTKKNKSLINSESWGIRGVPAGPALGIALLCLPSIDYVLELLTPEKDLLPKFSLQGCQAKDLQAYLAFLAVWFAFKFFLAPIKGLSRYILFVWKAWKEYPWYLENGQAHPFDPLEAAQIPYVIAKYVDGIHNQALCKNLEKRLQRGYLMPGDRAGKELAEIVEKGIALYRTLLPFSAEEREAHRAEILRAAKKKLQHYDAEVQDALLQTIFGYLKGAEMDGILLAGPSGTGKTYAVEQLGTIFPDGQMVEINLEGKGAEELRGSATSPGLFVETLAQAGKSGKRLAILLFNELEKCLSDQSPHSAELLPLLLKWENGKFIFWSPFFEAFFEVYALRYYTVNNFKGHPAFKNRTQEILMTGYSLEAKESLVLEPGGLLDQRIRQLQLAPDAVRTPALISNIRSMIKADQDPGLRTINRTINQLLLGIRMQQEMEADNQADAAEQSAPLLEA